MSAPKKTVPEEVLAARLRTAFSGLPDDLPLAPVTFVGAGPGALDLLTVRAARIIAAADLVIWAASLVSPEILRLVGDDATVHDSSQLALEEICELYLAAAREGKSVVRLHSGDTSLYSAIGEQSAFLDAHEIRYAIVPGVSSFGAAAAAIGSELTVPGVSQSVVLTRQGSRTPMPAGESLEAWAAQGAASGATLAVFLSAARPRQLEEALLAHYTSTTPCAVVYRVSWPDEEILFCTLVALSDTLTAAGHRRQVLVLVGPGVKDRVQGCPDSREKQENDGENRREDGPRSRLYDAGFSHLFRKKRKEAGTGSEE